MTSGPQQIIGDLLCSFRNGISKARHGKVGPIPPISPCSSAAPAQIPFKNVTEAVVARGVRLFPLGPLRVLPPTPRQAQGWTLFFSAIHLRTLAGMEWLMADG